MDRAEVLLKECHQARALAARAHTDADAQTHTHTNAELSSKLHEELKRTLEDDMIILLVHEQRQSYGAIPFVSLFTVTPAALLGSVATNGQPAKPGIYKNLAIPLYGGSYQPTSVRMILRTEPLFYLSLHPNAKNRSSRRALVVDGVNTWLSFPLGSDLAP